MDVDPFILGIAQSAGTLTPVTPAAIGILVAAASNNLAKGTYAWVFSDRKTGFRSLSLLSALALIGLTPILLIR